MSDSSLDTDRSGPSLEQILWRTVDRWTEGPSLVDADEFAAQISGAFQGEVPAETWIARFYGENPDAAPSDMAEAIVAATRDRLHVYEFDLNQLDYVVLEEKDKLVVVSDFGQFALGNDDLVTRAIEAAIIPRKGSAVGSEGTLDRSGSKPRAFFVRESGEVVAVDVKKLAKALDQQRLKQVSMPSVDEPMARLAHFAPVKKRLTDSREEKALRQDLRTLLPVPPPKLLAPARNPLGRDRSASGSAPPSGAETTVLVLLPDGSLLRPAIGSATRWQQMVSDWSVRASLLALGGSSLPESSSSQQRFAVQSGKVVALFSGGAGANDTRPGMAGDRAAAQSGGISAARADGAPIRILGDAELARAVMSATLLPGFRAQSGAPQNGSYWIQPEAFFATAASDRPLISGNSQGGGQPLRLGEITGDPWADWALTGGGDSSPSMMLAAPGRSKSAFLAALGRAAEGFGTGVPSLSASSSLRGGDLRINGQPVVAFRAPDGSVMVQRQRGSIRLAALSRPDRSEINDNRETVQLFPSGWARRGGSDLAERSGALPSTALASLQLALERTANAGGYKLPLLSLYSGVGGQAARMVLSMPFPNSGEVHVGSDLSDALHSYLGTPVLPSGSTGKIDLSGLRGAAAGQAKDALFSLQTPSLAPLLGRSRSVPGLPDLLARALESSGEWTPGPGSPMPAGILDFAMQGPFDLPELGELVEGVQPQTAAQLTRPLGVGEEEIVIPLPLWAQLGRGRISATSQIMASPFSVKGQAPPLGAYQLVRPFNGPADFTNGAPGGTPGIVTLQGPANLELVAGRGPGGNVTAQSLGGRMMLGRVAVDDGESVFSPRGRMRVGAPLDPAALQVRLEAARQAKAAQAAAENGRLVSAARATLPPVPNQTSASFIDGSYAGGARLAPQRSMAGALQSSLRMSDGVSGRLIPGRSMGQSQAAGRASAPSSSAAFSGLAPGAWSGDYRGSDGYATWSYGPGNLGSRTQSFGGVDLSGLARPHYPSLPTSLRFRYAGAPLWWSGSLRGSSASESAGDFEDSTSSRNRALRSGVRAANSAASIWRSILVSSSPWSAAGGSRDDSSDAGAMDRSWDASAGKLGSLGSRLDVLAGSSLVSGDAGAGALSGRGAESIYVAFNSAGGAGAVSAQEFTKPRASSIDMSMVAAIPPTPPPLESMGSSGGARAHAEPHARTKRATPEHKEGSDAVSHSKIEGSVDAVAQRIYHRIRRRIASDRERFGG